MDGIICVITIMSLIPNKAEMQSFDQGAGPVLFLVDEAYLVPRAGDVCQPL